MLAGLGTNVRIIPTTRQKNILAAGGDGNIEQESQGMAIRGGGSDDSYRMNPLDLAAAMQADRARGMTPMFVHANVGSTNTCAVDPLRAIGEVCRR